MAKEMLSRRAVAPKRLEMLCAIRIGGILYSVYGACGNCGEGGRRCPERAELVLLPCAGRQFAEDKLLQHAIDHPDAGGDQESLQNQPRAAIVLRIVQMRNSPRGKIASQAGEIRLSFPVVSSADKWAEDRMKCSG